jgi:hypothetical protein
LPEPLAAKMLPKIAFIFPLAQPAAPRHANLHDRAHEHRPDLRDDLLALPPERRDHRRDAILAARPVVVLSAVVPTAIAERWFLPDADAEKRVDRRSAGAQAEEYV